jgi:hypothetical protein
MINGFDAVAKQCFCESTIEGLDLGLETVLFRAVVAGNLETEQVCAALERWMGLVREGYFDIMDDGERDYQSPRTEQGQLFLEKLRYMRRLIDNTGSAEAGRQ